MARTLTEIENQILQNMASNPILSGLTSPSATAIFRNIIYLIALAHYTLEKLWDIFKKEVDDTIAQRRLGTPSWYTQSALDFQLGDNLNNFGFYEVIDDTKKIVKKASFKESNSGILTLKIAKYDNELLPLSPTELTQFRNYIDEIKFAGTRVNIVSLEADKLRMNVKIFFEGIFTETLVKENVKTAIKNHLLNLSFDGILLKNDLINAIRNVEGVYDMEFVAIEALQGNLPVSVGRSYETQAGYMIFDDNASILQMISQ
jgi:hypothetical protein